MISNQFKGPRVAAVQLVSGHDVALNLQRTEYWIMNAAEKGAEVILLPENFALLESKKALDLGQQEKTEKGAVRSTLSRLAKEYSVWLIAGSLPCALRPDNSEIDGRVRASCWVINNKGETVGRYDKIHLFDVDVEDDYGSYRESAIFEPGEDAVVVDTPAGKVGLTICYDLRFPELFRKLADLGAEWIVVPAAFTFTTGVAHWETLLRARAIENQVFVVAANQGGRHNEQRETYGHSMIIDPWGDLLACKDKSGEGVITAEFDFERQQQVRRAMPVLHHRRL